MFSSLRPARAGTYQKIQELTQHEAARLKQVRFVLFLAAVMTALGASTNDAAANADWVNIGPFGGPAGLIAIDRHNPERLIASSRNNNLFLTADGGAHWKRLPFPRMPGSAIEALAIHPRDSNRFYAGIADEHRGFAGLYESCDGGKSWGMLGDLYGKAVFSLAFFPGDPSILAAGTRDGVFLSRDDGKRWSKMQRGSQPAPYPVMSLAFDPENAQILYAGTTHLPWKTSDGGENWAPIHNGMIDDSDVFSIHVNSKMPSRVFASACSGIYASETAGERWRRAQGIPGTDRRTHVVTEDPSYPNIIYAGTTAGLYKSADSGHAWRKLNSLFIRSVKFSPTDSRRIYLATQDRGLLKSTTGGESFEEVNLGFTARPIHRLLFHGDSLVAVAQRTNGTRALYERLSGAKGWRELDGISGDAVSFRDVLYARTAKGVSRKGEQGWTSVLLPGPTSKSPRLPLRADVLEATATALWAVTSTNGLLKSTDGVQWTKVAQPDRYPIFEIFPGEKSLAIRTGNALWLTRDDGASWTLIEPVPGSRLFQLALHPDNADIIFATTALGLVRSTDRGRSWKKVESGLLPGFVYAVAADGQSQRKWYASQSGHLFESTDDGETWRQLEGEIPSALIQRIYVPHDDGKIFVITEGQGIFERQNLPIIRALGGEN